MPLKPQTVGLSVLAIAALIGGGTWIATRSGSDCGSGVVAGGAIGGPFELVSETGETVTDRDVISKPTLIYFGYTFCPDVCPIDAARNAAAVDLLAVQGIDVNSVFITVDPQRDTPEIVGQYTDFFHPDMVGLSGSDGQVADAARAYRVVYSAEEDGDPDTYLVSHSSFTYLVTPDEGFVDFFNRQDSPEAMADRIACYLK